jgi:hypothetical protein
MIASVRSDVVRYPVHEARARISGGRADTAPWPRVAPYREQWPYRTALPAVGVARLVEGTLEELDEMLGAILDDLCEVMVCLSEADSFDAYLSAPLRHFM